MTRIDLGELTALTTAQDADGHLHLAAQVLTEQGLLMGTLHVHEGGRDSVVRFRPRADLHPYDFASEPTGVPVARALANDPAPRGPSAGGAAPIPGQLTVDDAERSGAAGIAAQLQQGGRFT